MVNQVSWTVKNVLTDTHGFMVVRLENKTVFCTPRGKSKEGCACHRGRAPRHDARPSFLYSDFYFGKQDQRASKPPLLCIYKQNYWIGFAIRPCVGFPSPQHYVWVLAELNPRQWLTPLISSSVTIHRRDLYWQKETPIFKATVLDSNQPFISLGGVRLNT